MAHAFVIAYDIGTTGVKTCLFQVSASAVKLAASANADYPLILLANGGAEQDPDDWWNAMCETTRKAMEKSCVEPNGIGGISFCSQMQGLVLTDKNGRHVRPAMSYMDQRASKQMHDVFANGPQIEGANAFKLLRCLAETKAAPTSVKDPVWKYLWVKENEPENFSRAFKWLDVKEALICRCTGNFVMTEDSAYATMLCDTRNGRRSFSRGLCEMLGVNYTHMPKIIASTAQAGILNGKAAEELGLMQGTPVFGGGGDAAITGVGAGTAKAGKTHIYVGTSGWVSTAVKKQVVDIDKKIAAIVAAGESYQYFAEMETAGKCFEWVRDHLALDEIGIYLEKQSQTASPEAVSRSLYDYLTRSIAEVPAGSNGVLFAPWLHGNRCPFEDANVRGMFFNIGIKTGKRDMIRAVLEGICFHLRWMLEAQADKVKLPDKVRFVGGGAISPFTCQILADITGRLVETVEDPQDAGAAGAAIAAAVGLKILGSIEDADDIVLPNAEYVPDAEKKAVYDKSFAAFKILYKSNRQVFELLNGR